MVTFRVDEKFQVWVEVLIRLTYWTTVVKGGLCDYHVLTSIR